jgi:hypothetical protein
MTRPDLVGEYPLGETQAQGPGMSLIKLKLAGLESGDHRLAMDLARC